MTVAYHHSSRPIRSPLLAVACAILGLLLGVPSFPMSGFAPSVPSASDGEIPSPPPADDAEEDEAPADANDLVCSVHARKALASPVEPPAGKAVAIRLIGAARRPRPDVPSLMFDRPIALCRLTC